jgi:hypothetical protein
MKKLIYIAFVAILFSLTTVSAAKSATTQMGSKDQKEIAALRAQIKTLTAGNAEIARNLQTFDTLDYTVFSNQQWVRLHESHAKDIKVNWPDGHYTIGIERHISDLKYMFVYAPDTKIKIHSIRFGSGNMTCVTGVMTGTFTLPMPIGDGKFIQPTGKTFTLPMCTVGIWKNGVMIEEYLFWDNQTYMNQLGLGK